MILRTSILTYIVLNYLEYPCGWVRVRHALTDYCRRDITLSRYMLTTHTVGCMAAVLEELSSDKTPILWRLVGASLPYSASSFLMMSVMTDSLSCEIFRSELDEDFLSITHREQIAHFPRRTYFYSYCTELLCFGFKILLCLWVCVQCPQSLCKNVSHCSCVGGHAVIIIVILLSNGILVQYSTSTVWIIVPRIHWSVRTTVRTVQYSVSYSWLFQAQIKGCNDFPAKLLYYYRLLYHVPTSIELFLYFWLPFEEITQWAA